MNDKKIKDIDDAFSEEKVKTVGEEEKSYSKYLLYLILFMVLLFFSIFGITYSIYKGNSGEDSEIITDQIIFTYSDVDKAGNGINITNAIPISDQIGKAMVGKNQYFDFYITSSTGKNKILYQLLINKNQVSTLSNDNVRIYLSKIQGSYEHELVLTDFSNLKTKIVNNKEYYVLYEKTLSENLDNYSDSYRLRMWVKEFAKYYENKIFSIKVDVLAEQVEE